jgi:hypothetical protein
MKHAIVFVPIALLLFASCENAKKDPSAEALKNKNQQEQSATIIATKYPEKVFWGDQHVHTSWSGDAGAAGTTLGPEQALRFAKGEAVKSNSGQTAKLSRPLDWIAVTDHSDGMGMIAYIINGDERLMKEPIIKKWHDEIVSGDEKRAYWAAKDMIKTQSEGKLPIILTDTNFSRTVWDKNISIVEKYNNPGIFTAFIGYEWTSNYGGGNNLHRNIIYRGNGDEARKMLPENTIVSADPESLWKWMQAYEDKTGGKILAIPHNGNLSNGLMFSLTTLAGKPISKEYAIARNKWERLFEITQVKGTSEAHPSLSPNDEFANFEIWDQGNLSLQKLKEKEMLKTEYLREALKDGLLIEKQLGVNPFKYGIVGGSDAHTGLSAMDENNFFGKFKQSEPSKERWSEVIGQNGKVVQKGWTLSASGYTGVWATANTREALWDAMQRRETYATTGPRIQVRVFGGYDFTKEDLNANNFTEIGYTKGVPMGADLKKPVAGKKPGFLIVALKDPEGVNLDRVQVIKGWIDAKGIKHEKIYEAVWADAEKRKLNNLGKLQPVGNTVNVSNCTVNNSIGDAYLKTFWTDPDFNPALSAVYYVRVLEIPTPRWTTIDAMRFQIKMPVGVPLTIQERCYTSPIWYTPK